MPAAPVLREIFHELHEIWGKESVALRFEHGSRPGEHVDVLIYRPTKLVDVTSFATVGMAAGPMPGQGHGHGERAELWLGRHGRLTDDDERAVALELANLAICPWKTGHPLCWGEVVQLDHDFPTFRTCTAVLLSGPLVHAGHEYIPTSGGPVRIIHVVPITEVERAHAVSMPPHAFLEQLLDEVDVLTARP